LYTPQAGPQSFCKGSEATGSHVYFCLKCSYKKDKDATPIYAAAFYQGKTTTVIVSSDAGGTSDIRIKALKYIPGIRRIESAEAKPDLQ